jgi:hypothetical protein
VCVGGGGPPHWPLRGASAAARMPLRTPLRTPRFLETPKTEGHSTRGLAKTPLNAPKSGRSARGAFKIGLKCDAGVLVELVLLLGEVASALGGGGYCCWGMQWCSSSWRFSSGS